MNKILSRTRTEVCLLLLLWALPGMASDLVKPAEAIKHVGELVVVCGTVASANYARSSKGKPTYLNIDKAYPNQDFTAVVWGKSRGGFEYQPETLRNKHVCLHGLITERKGKAQMELVSAGQVMIKEE